MPAVITRVTDEDILQHHGILGMHWGVRRYRNKDGSLTAAGKKRYYKMDDWGRPIGFTKAGEKMVKREYNRAASAEKKATRKTENNKLWKRNVKQGKDKPNTSTVEYISRNVSNIADEGIKASKSILNEAHNIKKQKTYKNGQRTSCKKSVG